MCKLLNVSKSCYYEHLKEKSTARIDKSEYLVKEIIACFKNSKQTYGSPRITSCLQDKGIKTSKVTIARLMRKNNIRSITKKKFIVTTNSKHKYSISENLLNRNFTVNEPSKAWVSDITYVRTQEGWIYLTTIIDLFDRKVIGKSISDKLDTKNTIVKAFKDAAEKRVIYTDTIFHSDRGVQYASNEFRMLLNQYTKAQSMSRKGNCWDNAVAESFFSTFKKECVRKKVFYSKKTAYNEIVSYIEDWYNSKRKHSSLGNKSPLEFETKYRISNVA